MASIVPDLILAIQMKCPYHAGYDLIYENLIDHEVGDAMFGLFGGKKWQKRLAEIPLVGCQQGLPEQWLVLDDSVEPQRITVTAPFAVPDDWLAPLQADEVLGQFDWQLQRNIALLHNSQPELPLVYGNVVLIASGKGGVGKSSVTAQLAMALAQMGARVGVLDADIYGPSMPVMFGAADDKPATDGNKIAPVQRHGVAVSSLGYLTADKDAAIWRGPMASAALQQLLRDTKWPKLDYLLVDMPPGTGDIQLTFAQKLPVTGAVIVTTPQTVALADAERGITMFRKVGVPIVGLVENMSFYQCSACGQRDFIFGEQGGVAVAQAEQVPLLGQWPLLTPLRQQLDEGLGPMQEPENLATLIKNTATRMAAELYFSKQHD